MYLPACKLGAWPGGRLMGCTAEQALLTDLEGIAMAVQALGVENVSSVRLAADSGSCEIVWGVGGAMGGVEGGDVCLHDEGDEEAGHVVDVGIQVRQHLAPRPGPPVCGATAHASPVSRLDRLRPPGGGGGVAWRRGQ